jgi:hypothetical protein
MERKTIQRGVLLLLSFLVVLVETGCEFDVATPKYYDQAAQPATPSITQMVPDRAAPGVNTITIQGQNFSTVAERNKVYFGNVLVDVVSASPTALVVRRPNLTGTLAVKVVSYDALLVANAPAAYTIDPVMSRFGSFLEGSIETALAVDKNGNFYVFQDTPPNAYKVTPAGERTAIGTLAKTITDAVVAPDGQVIMFGRSLTIQKIDPATGTTTDWTRLTRQSVSGDFDKYGNLWTGGQNNGDLWCLKPDLTKAASGIYNLGQICKVRVFNDYVYVGYEIEPADLLAGLFSFIYRSKIMDATGTLGPKEPIYDRTQAGDFSASMLKDFAISAKGDLVIATDNATSPLLVVKNGTKDTLYKGIVPATPRRMVWVGNNLYLLVVTDGKGDLLKIDLGEAGAPYLGIQ